MNRSHTAPRPLRPRSVSDLADSADLRAVIAAALSDRPIDCRALRRGVWTYVGLERDAGMPPGRVVVALTEMVDGAEIEPVEEKQRLTRDVILWCVEAYFGHLGDGPAGSSTRDGGDVASGDAASGDAASTNAGIGS